MKRPARRSGDGRAVAEARLRQQVHRAEAQPAGDPDGAGQVPGAVERLAPAQRPAQELRPRGDAVHQHPERPDQLVRLAPLPPLVQQEQGEDEAQQGRRRAGGRRSAPWPSSPPGDPSDAGRGTRGSRGRWRAPTPADWSRGPDTSCARIRSGRDRSGSRCADARLRCVPPTDPVVGAPHRSDHGVAISGPIAATAGVDGGRRAGLVAARALVALPVVEREPVAASGRAARSCTRPGRLAEDGDVAAGGAMPAA